MSVHGILLIDLLGLGLILMILRLVRLGRLYAGYAALWIASTASLIVLVSLPSLLGLVTRALGAVFPVSALTLLAFIFMFLVLVLFSVKLTVLTERQTELIQRLALRELEAKERRQEEPGPGSPAHVSPGTGEWSSP
jgi:hypothetical protein